MRKFKKHLRPLLLALVVMSILCVPAFATSGGRGDVGAVVESTWNDAAGQVKTVVNNVVFPAFPSSNGLGVSRRMAVSGEAASVDTPIP